MDRIQRVSRLRSSASMAVCAELVMSANATTRRRPKTLMQMTAILRQEEGKDTPDQAVLREFFKKDPKGFMAEMRALEKVSREEKRQAKLDAEKAQRTSEPVVPSEGEKAVEVLPADEGYDRSMVLLEEFLAAARKGAEGGEQVLPGGQ